MKKTLLSLAAGLLLPMLAHAGCEEHLQTWTTQLQPQRTLDREHAVCKDWPADSALTLAVLPLPHADNDEDTGVFDLEVLVADRTSGAIVAHVYQPSAITYDAVRFSGIVLDTARYQLKPGGRAFGVRVSYAGSSRVNPFSDTSLSLYALEGARLRTVLDRLIVETSSGEWDGQCAGTFDATTRTIDMGPTGRGGYAALKIAGKTVRTVRTQIKDDCVDKDAKPARSSVTLPYRNGRYEIPKALRQVS